MSTLVVFLAGIIVLLFLVAKVKTNAFIGLLSSAFVMGVLAGMPPLDTVNTIASGFAATVEDIGLVIIFGVMLGKYLEVSQSTAKMALDSIRVVGQKRSSLAMAISGYIISIPVFSDAAFVLLSPLARAVAKKAKVHKGVIAVSLAAGLLATNVFVPPTPGPLAAAGMLGVDLGKAMFFGGIAALVMTLFGWGYAQFYLRKKPDSYYTYEMEQEEEYVLEEDKLPSSFVAFSPLVIPLILIISNTICKMTAPEGSGAAAFTSFIGNPNVALLAGVLVSIALLYKKMGKQAILKVMDDTLNDAGSIVFIVSAGGALGQVLKVSGAGNGLADVIISTGLPFILIPYAIAAIIKMINGSGTTSLITTVTICAPIVAKLGLDPVLLLLSASAGASICCHVNDSFFWVYARCMGFDMKTALKTLSISNIVESIGALLATLVISLVI